MLSPEDARRAIQNIGTVLNPGGRIFIIAIRCTAAINISLTDLTPLQGELKALTKPSFEKLKRSILKHGITFPFFVWQDAGANYILDGTQRDRVLVQMAAEGYTVPALPCALIEAKDRKEAAEKILLISKQLRETRRRIAL